MLLALADFLDSNWDTVWWTLGGLFGFQCVLSLIFALRRRSLRIWVWGGVAGLVTCSLLAVAWHFFGWETLHTDTGWTIRRHRTLGRVTHLAYDTNGNWFADAKVVYRYSDPWTPDDEFQHNYVVAKEDRNYDGRWDTWWRPTSEVRDGRIVLVIQADTDLDGQPDYEAREVADVPSAALEELKQRRGF